MRLPIDDSREIEILAPENSDPGQPLLILAHGAGNDMHSGFMETIAGHLTENRVSVVRFNFPYFTAGRKMPDRGPVLEEAWRAVIRWTQENCDYSQLFIGGKSMGGRVAATVGREFEDVRGVVFLGYPLHPPGKFEHRRDEYLNMLRKPMLFIQGTRDPFARMDLLQDVLSDIREFARLEWVEGGDHSFKVLVRQGVHYPEVLKNVALEVADWTKQLSNKM